MWTKLMKISTSELGTEVNWVELMKSRRFDRENTCTAIRLLSAKVPCSPQNISLKINNLFVSVPVISPTARVGWAAIPHQ